MKKFKSKFWIITGNSESGDEYGPELYDHEPTRKEKRDFIESTGEELDCDGPGAFGSYVHLKVKETHVN